MPAACSCLIFGSVYYENQVSLGGMFLCTPIVEHGGKAACLLSKHDK